MTVPPFRGFDPCRRGRGALDSALHLLFPPALLQAILIPVLPFAGSAVSSSANLLGQPTFSVEGRVVEKHAAAGISGVTLELEGPSFVATGATSDDGRFRFDGIEAGGYTLRVLGEGFRPRSQYVYVDEDVALVLPVAAAPVEPGGARHRRWGADGGSGASGVGTVALRGVVREGEWGLPLDAVEVLTNRGRATRTGSHGKFVLKMDGLRAGGTVLMGVRAFGYLPLDTVVVAGDGAHHDFQLQRDRTVQRRIRREVERLETRIAQHDGPVYVLGREALLASRAESVAGAIRAQHGELLHRVRCLVVDDRGGRSAEELTRLAPGELQRVELLLDPSGSGDAAARVYTRNFIRDLVGGGMGAEEVAPAYIEDVAETDDGPFATVPSGDSRCGRR